MAEGHLFANRYPFGRLWAEVKIAHRRINNMLSNEATAVQMAVASLLTKKGQTAFKEFIKSLQS